MLSGWWNEADDVRWLEPHAKRLATLIDEPDALAMPDLARGLVVLTQAQLMIRPTDPGLGRRGRDPAYPRLRRAARPAGRGPTRAAFPRQRAQAKCHSTRSWGNLDLWIFEHRLQALASVPAGTPAWAECAQHALRVYRRPLLHAQGDAAWLLDARDRWRRRWAPASR